MTTDLDQYFADCGHLTTSTRTVACSTSDDTLCAGCVAEHEMACTRGC